MPLTEDHVAQQTSLLVYAKLPASQESSRTLPTSWKIAPKSNRSRSTG
jgi:hypothetical protein